MCLNQPIFALNVLLSNSGEGITIINNVIYLLTWREHVLLRIDATTLETISTHVLKTVTGEGWGITHTPDLKSLIISDGSELLYFVDPNSITEARRVHVTLDGKPIPRINELEFINGFVYANVWYEDWLLKIDPANGDVVRLYDLRALAALVDTPRVNHGAVLNGIAFDSTQRKLWVTGKLWPTIFIG